MMTYKEVYILEGGLTPYLTLGRNEYKFLTLPYIHTSKKGLGQQGKDTFLCIFNLSYLNTNLILNEF